MQVDTQLSGSSLQVKIFRPCPSARFEDPFGLPISFLFIYLFIYYYYYVFVLQTRSVRPLSPFLQFHFAFRVSLHLPLAESVRHKLRAYLLSQFKLVLRLNLQNYFKLQFSFASRFVLLASFTLYFLESCQQWKHHEDHWVTTMVVVEIHLCRQTGSTPIIFYRCIWAT